LQTNDFESFYRIWHQSAKRKSLWIPGKKEYSNLIDCFGKNCFCITIDNQAGALILIHEKTAYYYYAGATEEGTKINLPYLVVWESMQEAKKRGCRFWDFEGIYDARFPNKGWLGFSHFKKSFGGIEITFPGNTTIWL
jgi:lipid II:glycine glycyltransferase (peptidoglycan interpeptide bridge formation enzyme)